MSGDRAGARPIPAGSTREVFRDLVVAARQELGQQPSPLATRYVVDLLDSRVRCEPPPPSTAADTLAESLLTASLEQGSARLAGLRALGDRALFDAGFFGESLDRRTVGIDYYQEIGRTAYARVSSGLADSHRQGPSGSALFYELARDFADFVELVSEVAERARGRGPVDLLRLYDRYRALGDDRDRARLLRHGLIPPSGTATDRPQ